MWIVAQDGARVINTDHISVLYMDSTRRKITARVESGDLVVIAVYKEPESCKTAFNELLANLSNREPNFLVVV